MFEDWIAITNLLKKEGKLLKFNRNSNFIFVGDTHGDIDATQKVISRYLKPGYKIVFLGDYVDRGSFSRENIFLLFETKLKYPDQVFLLSGNHETHHIMPFAPSDFWDSLNDNEYAAFSEVFSLLPLAATIDEKIIALHGVIPDLNSPNEIEKIEIGSDKWRQIVWGDLYEIKGYMLGTLGGRVAFGKDYLEGVMNRMGLKLLIRAHQRNIDTITFNGRCVTLMTSFAYSISRKIAIMPKGKPIESAYDLEIEEI